MDEKQLRGLSEAEVLERRRKGQGNDTKIQTGRTYTDIIRQNVINLINVILFTIGAVMIALQRYSDAVTSVGLIVLNAAVGIYQEIRAKRQLDQIALLTRPTCTVIRDGNRKSVLPEELVIGDLVALEAGDQIVVDGVVVGTGKIEADESLLTGESDLIPKTAGDGLLSGSFVVSGKAEYEVTKVGAESFANKLTANARQFRVQKTPLQRDVDLVIRFLMLLALIIGFLMLLGAVLHELNAVRSIQMAAVIAGVVPNGLFFMVIVAYALGALRIVQRGALVQQSNSVESLSNVNVLCMDKTGTLTANRIAYHDVRPLGMDKDLILKMLGDFARSASITNKTSDALIAGLAGEARPITDEIPFSSARKWSALAFEDKAMYGVYALGALEMLQPYFPPTLDLTEKLRDWSDAGLRVLVFAYNPTVAKLHDSLNQGGLPELTPLAIVAFSDELRPHLRETLQGFLQAGIELKVISGDNPQTVAALAKQAGFPGDLKAVSGTELALMTEAQFDDAATSASVFGRITPDQKEKLVDALKRRGKYVAMIGDGVNDVLSLKKANLGISMQSGSAATRGVADMILLNDSFGALPPAFLEGQRIINGMQDILRLFLSRALYVAILIFAVAVIGLGFPFLPKHNTLLTFITVAIPTFMLAVWARPGKLREGSLVAALTHFVIPSALVTLVYGLLVFVGAYVIIVSRLDSVAITPEELDSFRQFTGVYDITDQTFLHEQALLAAQTALTVFVTFAGLILLIFVEPPTRWWVGGDLYSGDWRPTILALALMGFFLAILNMQGVRQFFELVTMPLSAYVGIGLMVLVWALTLRAAWRGRWLERFLGLPPLRPEIDISETAEKKTTLVTQQVKALTQV